MSPPKDPIFFHREPARIKRLNIGVETMDVSKEPSPSKNTSNNLVLLTQKNLKLIRRKYGGGGGNKSSEQGRAQSGESSKMRCSTPAAESRATRITIIQGNHRLEPPNNFVGKTGGNGERDNNILCLPSIIDKLIAEESEVPT